jgi:hypothetical protein
MIDEKLLDPIRSKENEQPRGVKNNDFKKSKVC